MAGDVVEGLGLVIGDGPGSPEFRRQAAAWSHSPWGGPVIELKVSSLKPPLRFAKVVDVLMPHRAAGGRVAIFCHGWANGLQLVPMVRIRDLAHILAEHRAPVVTLYACSTADGPATGGDGGFADRLRDALCAAGAVACRVDAHATAGHATRNPYVRRFEGMGVATGGVGGQWIVTPKSALWGPWARALKGDLRWEFPLLSVAEIHARLAPP